VSDLVVVQTTVGSKEDAERLAKLLVEQRFAACVQVAPVVSFFIWNDKLSHDDEYVLTIKTCSASVSKLESEMRAAHPYVVPEFVVIPATYVTPDYQNWVAEATGGGH